ncbi:MAG: nicotinate dehydrogenase subunit B [Verrucomicrobiales bacterium]|jgi:nicotinate dehydrogenase subunit B
MKLTVNGESHEFFVDQETPLLDVLRNDLGLFGAKRGCAQEQCYACCVLVDGRTQPSCQLPVGHVEDLPIETVESLEDLRDFFLAEQVGQCGFCIAGMMVAAEGLLRQVRYPNDAQIREALDTNVCRCGVYDRVRRAIRFRIGDPEDPIWDLRPQDPLDPGSTSTAPLSSSIRDNPQLDTWIQIDGADTITVRSGKAELGQGIRTAVAHIAATQLCVDHTRIVILHADTDGAPNEGTTSGSMSIQLSGEAMSAAAATARSIMVSQASDMFGVPAESLVVADGTISDPASGQTTTYWEVQGGRPFNIEIDPTSPRVVDDVRSEGANTRIDLPAKLSGVPTYVHDFRDETTAHGRVLRPPHYEARLQSLDTSTVEAMPGVVSVVRNGSFVGVVAEREQHAEDAIDALRALAEWEGTSAMPTEPDDLLTLPLSTYDVVDGTDVDYEVGTPSRRADGRFDLTARYTKQFTMHGSLGPSAAVAHFDGEKLTIRSSTQGVYPLRETLAQAVNLPVENVQIHHAEGAGCYGHNGADDVSLDAALLAMAVPDRSILTAWSRADEHRWEPYGPAMIVKLAGDVRKDKIATFDFENWSYTHSSRPRIRGDGSNLLLAAWHLEEPFERPLPQPMRGRHIGAHRNADPIYSIENRRARVHLAQTTAVRTSALRGLGAFANVFATESFVDEMAHYASIDPVEFRLANLEDPRARAVVEAVAEDAWGTDRPVNTGRGIGFARYKNAQTYFAVIVELTVDRETGQIQLSHATGASDSGRIISPDGVSNQLEGGCVQAASWTLKEAVQLTPDQVTSVDWETYPVLRFSDSFPVRTILLDRPDQPPLGCGEAAQGPMAAAIANAVFDAVGVRMRDLPLTCERVKSALAHLPNH